MTLLCTSVEFSIDVDTHKSLIFPISSKSCDINVTFDSPGLSPSMAPVCNAASDFLLKLSILLSLLD